LSGELRGEAENAVFARRARPAPQYAPPDEAVKASSADRMMEWDEVDELFQGG
jgi:hypothetical protein